MDWLAWLTWIRDYLGPPGLILTAALAFFVSLCSLTVSLRSVAQARRAAIANVIAPLLREYADHAMFDHLRELRKYAEANGPELLYLSRLLGEGAITDEIVQVARKYVQWNEPKGEPLDINAKLTPIAIARRHVEYYFDRSWHLRDAGFINTKALKLLTDNDGFELLIQVAHPLALAVSLIHIHDGSIEAFRKHARQYEWHRRLAKKIGRSHQWKAPL